MFNACKYMPEEGHIAVTAIATDTVLVVSVSDTGIGIGEDALAHIFDVFVQEQHAVGYNRDGLGIGLALVQELVEAHAGTVRAYSDGVGRGSQFEVTLPCLAQEPRLNDAPLLRSA